MATIAGEQRISLIALASVNGTLPDGEGVGTVAVNKMYPDPVSSLAGALRDGMTIMSGGFGLCGIPSLLIEAIRESGVKDLTVISNNAGIDDAGLGLLLVTRQIRKMISSYVGENKPRSWPSNTSQVNWRLNLTRKARSLNASGQEARASRRSLPSDRRRHPDC